MITLHSPVNTERTSRQPVQRVEIPLRVKHSRINAARMSRLSRRAARGIGWTLRRPSSSSTMDSSPWIRDPFEVFVRVDSGRERESTSEGRGQPRGKGWSGLRGVFAFRRLKHRQPNNSPAERRVLGSLDPKSRAERLQIKAVNPYIDRPRPLGAVRACARATTLRGARISARTIAPNRMIQPLSPLCVRDHRLALERPAGTFRRLCRARRHLRRIPKTLTTISGIDPLIDVAIEIFFSSEDRSGPD